MRAKIIWNVDSQLVLPVAYHHILQGAIYHNMSDNYGFHTFVHDEGYAYDQRRFKMFCFSELMGNSSFKDKKLYFRGSVSFEISSPDVYLIRTIADNFRKNGIRLAGYYFPKVQVLLSDFTVESDEIIVNTLSPITVYTTDEETDKTIYFHPGQKEFRMAVNDNFQRKYLAYYGCAASAYVDVELVSRGDRYKCVTTYEKTFITGYSGTFKLRAPRKYLDFLYNTGLGAKNSQGFGMISFHKMKD